MIKDMAQLPIIVSDGQNWSCHSCAGCCSEHLIEITDEERLRIEKQGWTAADGVAIEPIVKFGGTKTRPRYRLAHQADGRCVFLDDHGLCRIHGKFGEPAKPLACQIYPYALHPHGKSVVVSLRFSCPSVIANKGKPVRDQLPDLKRIAAAIVPSGANKIPPPAISDRETVGWLEFELLIQRLTLLLTDDKLDVLPRIFRSLAWVHLVGSVKFQQLNRTQLREFLDLAAAAVMTQFQALPEPVDEPGRIGRMYFRLFCAQYGRKDTVQDLAGGWRRRWNLLRAAMKFTRGRGLIPPLQSGFTAVPFDQLESPFGGLPAGASELFTRYWRVKVEGLHFCGPAYYGIPFVEGCQSLLLVFPVTLWLARWRAASQGRNTLELADVEQALALADHHHGYGNFLEQRQSRSRIRYLAETGELTRLCVWYAR